MKAAVESYFGDRPRRDRPGPGRDHRRRCRSRRRTTTSSATPSSAARPSSPKATDCPKSQLVVPPTRPIVQRRDLILGPARRRAGRRCPGDQYIVGRLHGRQAARRSSSPARRRRAGSPRTSCGRSATSSPTSCAAPDAPTCDALERGGLRVTTTLDVEPPEDRREVGPGGGHRARTPRTRRRPPRRSASRSSSRGWPTCANKDLRNGALVALDYETGELVAYVGSANYYATSTKPDVPAAVRRRRQGLPPAGLGVQAVQLRGRHRRPDDHRRARC